MGAEEEGWMYEEAGPVSRPYTVTGGRPRPHGTRYLDLVDMGVRTGHPADSTPVTPERSQILELSRVPVSVAEVSALVKLPIGVVRVLLDDLLHDGLIVVREAAPRGGRVTDQGLLRKVLQGLLGPANPAPPHPPPRAAAGPAGRPAPARPGHPAHQPGQHVSRARHRQQRQRGPDRADRRR